MGIGLLTSCFTYFAQSPNTISAAPHANSLDWFLLAAAYAKQGEKEQARQAHQPAVQWMEKNRPGNVELRAVREEVAQVLQSAGVADDGPPSR